MKKFRVTTQHFDKSIVGKIIIPVTENPDRDQLLDSLSHLTGFDILRTLDAFEAKQGKFWRVLHDLGEIYFVGLGRNPNLATMYKVMRKFSNDQRKNLGADVGLFIHDANITTQNSSISMDEFIEYAVNGIFTGTNLLSLQSEGLDVHPLETLVLLRNDETKSGSTFDSSVLSAKKGLILAEAQLSAMHLINIPSNWKNPLQFSDTIKDMAEKWGFHCEIFDESRLKDEHFDALLAVNRGSEHPARFVVLQYDGTTDSDEELPLIALIGKGVTYDSGGLSIKSSDSMVHMKCDMGGAAIVLAATEAVARLGLKIRLLTAIPLTDNLVDARSIKPGDIIGSYSGKTIEVIDTDAEGRLILADAIGWVVKNASPDYMIDLATLTGSTVRTFGPHASAMFTNNKHLNSVITESGDKSGERVWPLPLWDVYDDDIRSDIADVRNFSGKPVAGSISAAKFLEYFTEEHPAWVHLDVAGTVYGDTEFGKQKNATGYGVRLIVESLIKLSNS